MPTNGKLHYRFKGNPNTNAAGRYSLAMQRWRDGGCKGPEPQRPKELEPQPDTEPTPEETAKAAKQAAQRKQGKLF